MIKAYNKRIEPRRVAGLPEPVFYAAPMVLAMIVMVIVVPPLVIKVAFLAAAIATIFLIVDVFRWYDDWLIRDAVMKGQEKRKLPSWGSSSKKTYLDGFTWLTKIGDHGLMHRGSCVSVAIEWDGIQDRHWSDPERVGEHRRRVALLRSLSEEQGLTIENHLLRVRDDRLINAYMRRGAQMHEGKDIPPIVADIRNQLAETYRPLARSNRVMTVLSLAIPEHSFLKSLFSLKMVREARNAQELYASLEDLFSRIAPDFPGARLLTSEEYQERIQSVRNPYADRIEPEWRFPLADQIVTTKPMIEDGCVVLDGRYYYSCVIQGYPDMGLAWTLGFVEAPVDLHVSQIIMPKHVDQAVDKGKKDADYEAAIMDQKRGADKAAAKSVEARAYRQHVINHNLPVADNAYIVTFCAQSPSDVKDQFSRFQMAVHRDNGLVRHNDDLQLELFDVRLPGLGRNTTFAREDHGDVLAAMMPVTTFPAGETKAPESLRISMSGQLVGFAPSKVEVGHEMVVAQTGGGKDTQFGVRFLETYPVIRYDIVEMGNSYQGAVEAVGGSYCRAREQVINPLAGYDEFQSARNLVGGNHLETDFIRSQADMLQPVFKGMKGPIYTRPEQACVEKALRHLYENPGGKGEAPTLPMVMEALGQIEATTDGQVEAQKVLQGELREFLETETGRAFTAQDQFTISPIANAIDFGGFSGELLEYYMTFMVVRLATNAMSRGVRSQIVLNEYKMLLQNAADPIRWITLTIDRMGRKEWVGLTRITQGVDEVRSVDPEALSSIPNQTLLSRSDGHAEIGQLLDMPASIVDAWRRFRKPDEMNKRGYREALVLEGAWHHLFLKFPQLALDLMNTRGEDKQYRERAYRESKDPYERIRLFKQYKKEGLPNENQTEPLV